MNFEKEWSQHWGRSHGEPGQKCGATHDNARPNDDKSPYPDRLLVRKGDHRGKDLIAFRDIYWEWRKVNSRAGDVP